MHIIGTVKKAGALALAAGLIIFLLAGSGQKKELLDARENASESQLFYQRAVAGYKDLISRGKDPDKLYLELGVLYYGHGDFEAAAEALRKSAKEEARRLSAMACYRLGDFTGALEAFDKGNLSDGEYLYYHGLTCEKLNLFDQALAVYRKIKGAEWGLKAQGRIEAIEKRARTGNIRDIDPAVSRMISAAPPAEKHPQAGALILYCDERIEVSPEGTETSYLHYLVKILNERGKEKFSETSLDYDSTYEKVELEFARTIKPDGTVVDVGSRHIRNVSKYLNFPLYSNARVYIISFPEMAAGSVIEYKVKVQRNQLINKKDVVLAYSLQSSEPIIAANLTFSLPKVRPLHIKIINEKYNDFGADLKPQVEEKAGRMVYSWKFKDIPEIIPESDMPSYAEVDPTILLSTFGSWDEVYSWWWALARGKIKADAGIKEKVRQLTEGKSTPEDKARAVYNFCAQEIRYVAVEYGQAGYEPHSAEDIFKNKYGDCKDQAVLLVTMLKSAGLESWPVLISTRDYYNLSRDFASSIFNHCIAAVSLGARTVFMDPTAQTCSFDDLPSGDQERSVLVFKDKEYTIEDTPLYPKEHNYLRQSFNVAVDEGEDILVDKVITGGGIYAQKQRFWLLFTQPELIKDTIKEKIQELTVGGRLHDYSIGSLKELDKPVTLSYVFSGPEFFTAAGPLRILPQLSNLDSSLVARESRRYPLDFDVLDTQETVFEISLPAGFTVKYMPSGISEENPWLKFSAGYDYKDNKIYFRQSVELKSKNIPEDKYPEFKKYFESLIKRLKQRIVLEKAAGQV